MVGNANFIETPDTAVPKKKVIMATSVISTGHNITKNVNRVCVFLHVGILCSEEDKQLIARTRPSDVLDPIYICFIEPGRGGRHETRYANQYAAAAYSEVYHLLKGVWANIVCSAMDTKNRHIWLFVKDKLNYDLTELPAAGCSDEEINKFVCESDKIMFDSLKKTNSGTILDHLSRNGNYELLGTLQKQCGSKIKERLINETLWKSHQKDWVIAFKDNVVFDPKQL